jgi:hypothetical protein
MDLHPDGDLISGLKGVTRPNEKFNIPLELCRKAVSRLNRESAGGISGWTAALAKVVARDPAVMEFLHLLTIQIANGNAPGARMLTSASLTPLKKSLEGGIRPIAVGEIWYRLAATSISYACRVENDLLPNQFGVGTSGGVEPLVHLIKAAVKTGSSIIQLDLKNAFNMASRLGLRGSIIKHNKKLCPFFDWSYGTPATLFITDHENGSIHTILSQQGVRQGDPLGPYLFSLAYRSQLDRLRKAIDQEYRSERSLAAAYLDDTFLIIPKGTEERALRVVSEVFDDEAIRNGFVMRPDKT